MIALQALSLVCFAQTPQQVAGWRIRPHVRFLASDLLEGRGVGTRGGQLAEEYIAAQLEASGVKPAGENGTFFQTVPLVGVTISPQSRLTAMKGSQSTVFQWQTDFVGTTHQQKPQTTFDAEMVFVGHGISSPDDQWNDYKKTDVKGKVVVLFTNEPQPDNPEIFRGKTLTYKGRWTYKYEEAARQGALGALIVHTTPTAGYGWEVVRNSWSNEDPQVKVQPGQNALAFAGWLTQEAGQKLFAMAGQSLDDLMKKADSRDFQPIPLGIHLKADVQATMREVQSRNVAGRVEGSDPSRKQEAVVFTAHWDHLGIGLPVNGDKIYNGAVDNATGCGIVLEIARAWASLEQKPGRSALFLFVTAEEAGLRGSEYYSRHPLVPPGKTAMNINYDALFPYGRTKDIVVLGAERTTAYPLIQDAAERFGFTILPDPRPEQGSYYRSDHFMMARAGIPAFSVKMGSRVYGQPDEFASRNFDSFNQKNYHQPSDEYKEDWDFSGMEQAGRFGMAVGLSVADAPRLPTWKPGDEFLSSREASGVR